MLHVTAGPSEIQKLDPILPRKAKKSSAPTVPLPEIDAIKVADCWSCATSLGDHMWSISELGCSALAGMASRRFLFQAIYASAEMLESHQTGSCRTQVQKLQDKNPGASRRSPASARWVDSGSGSGTDCGRRWSGAVLVRIHSIHVWQEGRDDIAKYVQIPSIIVYANMT